MTSTPKLILGTYLLQVKEVIISSFIHIVYNLTRFNKLHIDGKYNA